MQEIDATLALTREDISYIWNGGTLAVKIDGSDVKVSLDITAPQGQGERRRQNIRIKRVQAKHRRAPA